MRNRSSVLLATRCALLAATALAGCSETLVITQIPEFYSPDLKAIAVAPFRNQTARKGAGDIIADNLATGLMANGTYKTFNRNDLKALMDENDLQIAMGGNSAAAAGKLKKLTQVQAILVGSVTTFAATSNSQPQQVPDYDTDRYGNSYVSGYHTVIHTRNEANVSVTASLIRVSDGTTIYATPQPLWARVWAEGSPPGKDVHACSSEASAMVAAQLLETFAPIRKQIKVDPHKALQTASELYDNKWTYQDTFKAADAKMYVVVALPASCDRNRFRLVVVKKDQREELASQDIKWSKEHAGFGYTFSPGKIAAKGGPGEYEVKFYSGPEPVMRRKFTIQ
jgi:hypothetical protein